MTARKLMLCAAAAVSVFSFSLARADEAKAAKKEASSNETAGASAKMAAPKRKPATATKKVGEACKTSDDCAGDLICGKGKCEQDLREVGHPAT
jgi:hypothetical protein